MPVGVGNDPSCPKKSRTGLLWNWGFEKKEVRKKRFGGGRYNYLSSRGKCMTGRGKRVKGEKQLKKLKAEAKDWREGGKNQGESVNVRRGLASAGVSWKKRKAKKGEGKQEKSQGSTAVGFFHKGYTEEKKKKRRNFKSGRKMGKSGGRNHPGGEILPKTDILTCGKTVRNTRTRWWTSKALGRKKHAGHRNIIHWIRKK